MQKDLKRAKYITSIHKTTVGEKKTSNSAILPLYILLFLVALLYFLQALYIPVKLADAVDAPEYTV